jgi:cytochrome P450
MDAEIRFTPESLATPDVRVDPYPAYRHLRPQSPFLYPYLPAGMAPGLDEPVMAWALMRHADVDRAVRDHETFRSAQSPIVEKGLSPHLTLLFDDPPRHHRLRRLINYAFTARRVEALEPWIGQVAGELLDGLGPGEAEVMERFAVPLPMMVIARLLGIPRDEYRTFRA